MLFENLADFHGLLLSIHHVINVLKLLAGIGKSCVRFTTWPVVTLPIKGPLIAPKFTDGKFGTGVPWMVNALIWFPITVATSRTL